MVNNLLGLSQIETFLGVHGFYIGVHGFYMFDYLILELFNIKASLVVGVYMLDYLALMHNLLFSCQCGA